MSPRSPLQLALWLIASFTLHAAPDWTLNPTALGNADMEGRLAIALPMGAATGSAPEFGLQLQLVHTAGAVKLRESARDARIDLLRKAAGMPAPNRPARPAGAPDPQVTMYRSSWLIPQLKSFLYPANRDRLIWSPPGGGEIIFTREEMDAQRYSPEGWYCAEREPGVYQISDREGWTWTYKDGLPASLTAPSGRLLEFFYEDGLLTRIVQRQGAQDRTGSQTVLRVMYDEARRPLKLWTGPDEHQFIYDKLTGHLTAWFSNTLGVAVNVAAARQAINEARPEIDPALNMDVGAPQIEGRAMGAVRFAYPNDLLEAIRLPNGKVQRFKWDIPQGRLLADGDASYSHSGGEDSGYTLSRTDKEGRTTRVEQDPRRAELIMTYPDGTRDVMAYQRRAAGRGQLREKRDAAGRVLQHIDYNNRHLPSRIQVLGEPEIRQNYDDRDRLIEVWRAPSATSTARTAEKPDESVPQERGQLVRRLTYQGASRRPASVTDAMGRTTRYVYDGQAQLVAVESPDGGVIRMKYDNWGRLIERELPGGNNREFLRYDEQGRLIEHSRPDGSKLAYAYDKSGRLAQRTENGATFQHRYDEAGRPVEVLRNFKPWWKWAYRAEAPTLPSAKKAPAKWAPWGPATELQTVVFTDERGGQTKRCYDADGRLILVVNPVGEQTAYRYNTVGEAVGWVDGRGHALMFERDNMGRIVRQENALGQVLQWKFDAAGRLAERANGVQTARYAYNKAGRLESIDYGGGQRVDYLRDGYGRVISATTAEVGTIYAYDALDRVIRIEQRPAKGEASGVAYTYAPGGQKREVTLLKPGMGRDLIAAGTTTTSHDILGRIEFIDVDGKREATHRYDSKTLRLVSKTLGNGLTYRYAYDESGRREELLVLDSDGRRKQRLGYEWNEYGLLERRVLERFAAPVASGAPAEAGGPSQGAGESVEAEKESPAPARVEIIYGYDALGRLVSARSPQDERQNRRYAYDEAGNLIENRSPENWLTMEYDAANQLVVRREKRDAANEAGTEQETHFAYDVAGRMTREVNNGRVDRSFTYGYLDKVMRVDRPEGRSAFYAYDASGMLVRKATLPRAGARQVAMEQETWVWDGLALVRRGNDYYVNEPHVAGGEVLMSRSLAPEAP